MSKNFKKMLSYYKPYRCIFWADMFFATVSAAVALAIPLVIRYVTYTLVYEDKAQIMFQIKIIAAALFAMVAADCYSKFFISNYGHVMGAKIEYNMRAEIFEHLQKLSFSFYDNQKVGQLMSRITTDLFDITELMHHGPENIILSADQDHRCVCDSGQYQPLLARGVHRPAVYVCVRVLPEWQNAACVPPEPCEDRGDQRTD